VMLFSLSILTDKIVPVVPSCRVPTHPFPGMVIPVCQITNGGCRRKTLIVMSEREPESGRVRARKHERKVKMLRIDL
jgi:hypothetical protein